MRKTLSAFFCLLMVLTLCGCGETATMAVDRFFARYNNLDEAVLQDMNRVIAYENINESMHDDYEQIIKKQYKNLTYQIENEVYDGDEAIITVKITVFDLYKVQRDASRYLANNADVFNNEEGIYDVSKYLEYKLDKMKNVTEKIDYTIDLYVLKTGNSWQVSSLSESDLEKIHGIYNYES